jgi:hypothetical protein
MNTYVIEPATKGQFLPKTVEVPGRSIVNSDKGPSVIYGEGGEIVAIVPVDALVYKKEGSKP